MKRPPSTAPRTRRPTGRVTLADVARLAEVSSQTVSRVLNTPDQVVPQTVEKVRVAIDQLGYQPLDNGAQRSAVQRSRLVAVLVPTIGGAVFAETVESLHQTLRRNGYQMMLGELGYSDEDEAALLKNILQRRPDGLVLTRVVTSTASRALLRASKLPIVESWDTTRTPIDMLIGFSHGDVGRTVARHFHELGRRSPGLIIGDDPRATRRGEAYEQAIAKMHLLRAGYRKVPTVRVPAPASLGSGRQGLATLLEQCPSLDAVFCSTDMVALGVLIEARKRGLDVPRQLAVIGFGDLGLARHTDPALTTVRIDCTAIGQRAAHMVMSRAEGLPIVEPEIDIGFSLARRESA